VYFYSRARAASRDSAAKAGRILDESLPQASRSSTLNFKGTAVKNSRKAVLPCAIAVLLAISSSLVVDSLRNGWMALPKIDSRMF
jgi:hypothetical protein